MGYRAALVQDAAAGDRSTVSSPHCTAHDGRNSTPLVAGHYKLLVRLGAGEKDLTLTLGDDTAKLKRCRCSLRDPYTVLVST